MAVDFEPILGIVLGILFIAAIVTFIICVFQRHHKVIGAQLAIRGYTELDLQLARASADRLIHTRTLVVTKPGKRGILVSRHATMKDMHKAIRLWSQQGMVADPSCPVQVAFQYILEQTALVRRGPWVQQYQDSGVTGGHQYQDPGVTGGHQYTDTGVEGQQYQDTGVTWDNQYQGAGVTGGYEYPDPGVTRGHQYQDPGVTGGYEYQDSGVTGGYEYQDPGVTGGYEYQDPGVTGGHQYQDPGVTEGYEYQDPGVAWGHQHHNTGDITQPSCPQPQTLPSTNDSSSSGRATLPPPSGEHPYDDSATGLPSYDDVTTHGSRYQFSRGN